MRLFYFAIVPLLIYLIIKSKKIFQVFQQNRYNEANHYLRWIYNNLSKVFYTYDLIFIPLYIIVLILEKLSLTNYALYIIYIVYIFVIYFYIKNSKKSQLKQPLVYTRRVKRLYVTFLLIYFLAIYFLTTLNISFSLLYLLCSILVYISFIIIFIANLINIPIEKIFNYYYWHKAHTKILNMSNTKVIGITGSYGKTSSKNILNEILNIKYTSFETPKNYNTVNGLCNTINNYLDKFNDFFIAEMGAVKVDDIKKCCKLVKPKFGILTTIGLAHLETFGTKEKIENEKFQLIESLPSDGLGILNGDDEIQLHHKINNNCKIMMIGIDNKNVDCLATNIKLSYKGTNFDVVFKGDSTKYHFETCLLGKANIYNLLTGILLGKYLGISVEQLIIAVKNIKPVEHRLQIKKLNDINLIDDAYNSNPIGSKMAVEVLGMMPGKKIIVTPGMIELGNEQDKLNKKLGNYIALNKIDEVILVGEKQTKPIYEGLKECGYNDENIHIINDVTIAFSLMKKLKGKETYVLLENDLPDVFNE